MDFLTEANNAGRRIGYARVSTDDQKLDLQMDALRAARCDLIFTDHGVSGRKSSRRGLDDLLDELQAGDTLYVYKLNRLGRSTRHLSELLTDFIQNDIAFCSLSEAINISTSSGKLMYHMIAGFAEFDCDIIRENTIYGMAAAKARGKHIGRPFKLTKRQMRKARRMVLVRNHSVAFVAEQYGVAPNTIYRTLKRLKEGRV